MQLRGVVVARGRRHLRAGVARAARARATGFTEVTNSPPPPKSRRRGPDSPSEHVDEHGANEAWAAATRGRGDKLYTRKP
jgi:hypothetical protein